MRTYWALVWHEANAAAWKWVVGHISAAMITTGAVAAGLAALWGWGSIDGFKDQVIVLSASLLAMALTYGGILAWHLLALPPRLHAELRSEIDRVKALSLSPLTYRGEPTDQKNVAWLQDKGPYGHVVLFNQRTDKSVRDVEVHLVRITLLDARGEPARNQFSLDGLPVGLVTRDGERRKDIPPEDEEAFVLCEAHWAVDPSDPDQIDQPSQLTIAPGRKGAKSLILPTGRYRFEVVAKGLDIPPRRQTYVVDATAAGFSFSIETPSKALA